MCRLNTWRIMLLKRQNLKKNIFTSTHFTKFTSTLNRKAKHFFWFNKDMHSGSVSTFYTEISWTEMKALSSLNCEFLGKWIKYLCLRFLIYRVLKYYSIEFLWMVNGVMHTRSVKWCVGTQLSIRLVIRVIIVTQ